MSDIVSELRENGSDMAEDAANEIDSLRQQLHESGDGDTWREACLRVTAELEIVRQKLSLSYQECETHLQNLSQAEILLQRSKVAVLEADSDFSAYAAGRPLDKESADRISWMCRQLYSDIKKWLLNHNGSVN